MAGGVTQRYQAKFKGEKDDRVYIMKAFRDALCPGVEQEGERERNRWACQEEMRQPKAGTAKERCA